MSKLIGEDIKKAYFDFDINNITSTTHGKWQPILGSQFESEPDC